MDSYGQQCLIEDEKMNSGFWRDPRTMDKAGSPMDTYGQVAALFTHYRFYALKKRILASLI